MTGGDRDAAIHTIAKGTGSRPALVPDQTDVIDIATGREQAFDQGLGQRGLDSRMSAPTTTRRAPVTSAKALPRRSAKSR